MIDLTQQLVDVQALFVGRQYFQNRALRVAIFGEQVHEPVWVVPLAAGQRPGGAFNRAWICIGQALGYLNHALVREHVGQHFHVLDRLLLVDGPKGLQHFGDGRGTQLLEFVKGLARGRRRGILLVRDLGD